MKRREPVDLSAECDFSKVAPTELKEAFLYEYARESPAVIRVVKELRKHWDGTRFRNHQQLFEVLDKNEIKPTFRSTFCFKLASCCADFPKRSWQKLTAEQKQPFDPIAS